MDAAAELLASPFLSWVDSHKLHSTGHSCNTSTAADAGKFGKVSSHEVCTRWSHAPGMGCTLSICMFLKHIFLCLCYSCFLDLLPPILDRKPLRDAETWLLDSFAHLMLVWMRRPQVRNLT